MPCSSVSAVNFEQVNHGWVNSAVWEYRLFSTLSSVHNDWSKQERGRQEGVNLCMFSVVGCGCGNLRGTKFHKNFHDILERGVRG